MGDCSDGFADCDADPATGCEIDVTSSPLHCGGCGKVCPTFPNARPACESSMCTFGSCEEGWVDCNRSQADGCELRLGGECSPNEYPCFDTALSCDAERSRPVCTPGEPLPERTPCFETGMCDGRGQCMCRPGAEVNERCGPEHVCDPDGLCVRNVQWYTVDCATAPEGLSGHEICRLLGFGGLARTANGWWWGECGGPNGSTGGVDNCVEYDAEGTRCLSFCASDARSVDCTGAPLCGEDRPIELLDDGEKRFVPSQYADCRDGNPGWSVRVQCVFN